MNDLAKEKILTRLISIGSALITILLISGSVTDPVNVPKLLLLGAISFGIFAVVLQSGFLQLVKANRHIAIIVALFFLAMISSVSLSKLPMSQNFYGAYGRNSGLLTYMCLTLVLVGTFAIQANENLKKVLMGLGVAGSVNLVYCLWVISFGDFIGWSNPYGNILGTLGNPNFIGAFLGIFFSVCMAFVFDMKTSVKTKVVFIGVSLVALFEIFDSNAIQGRVVSALGLGVVLFFAVRSRFSSLITSLYSLVFVAAGTLAALGALQIGPLTQYIYKYSVSLRGQYWLAGWNTGMENPIHGVGMDGFGDWYRRARDVQALTTPGVNTVVNAAHNVFLDMFAFGGWPLLLSYSAIMILAGVSLIRVVLRSKTYDPIFVAISVAWLGYQLQSIISINQIGLAIWGWVLTGALIAYERNTRNLNAGEDAKTNSGPRNKGKNISKGSVVSPGLLGGIGMVIGAIIASPPLSSDTKWRSAQLARSVPSLEASLTPSFMNPQHTTRYLVSVQAFEESNLPELAYKYAQAGVKFDPDNFELWKVFYLIQASTPEEKALALENMKRLDPLNPDVTAR
ncbi:O-antigen ligase family protein [Candidatus Planktophila dulcis]|uniref:O-antigen ligase family protein n=1 Tax=Candidatus Planktophila dulcis TaxID=1884914 RepID=UPI003CE773B9